MRGIRISSDIDGIRHVLAEEGVLCRLLPARGGCYNHRECVTPAIIERLMDVGSFCPLCYNRHTGIDYQWPGMEEYLKYMRTAEHIGDWIGPLDKIQAGKTYKISTRGDKIMIPSVSLGLFIVVRHSWPTPDGEVVVGQRFESPGGPKTPGFYLWGLICKNQFFVAEIKTPGHNWYRVQHEIVCEARDHAHELNGIVSP